MPKQPKAKSVLLKVLTSVEDGFYTLILTDTSTTGTKRFRSPGDHIYNSILFLGDAQIPPAAMFALARSCSMG